MLDMLEFLKDEGVKPGLIEQIRTFRGQFPAEEELRRLDPAAVVGIRAGRFGAEALILRSALPGGMVHQPATLEDIMLYHIKEEH